MSVAAEPLEAGAAPEPEFSVLGVRAVRHTASPMLALDLQVLDGSGREVYMIALSIQVMIEPARRVYDGATREKLVELFGPPERWATTTRSLVWARLDVLVPSFTGASVVEVPLSCRFDLELAAAKFLHSLPGGEAPLALHFNGTVYYRGPEDRLQMVLVPWNRSIDFRMPVAVWQEAIAHHFPGRTWMALSEANLEALAAAKRRRGLATLDACVSALLQETGDA